MNGQRATAVLIERWRASRNSRTWCFLAALVIVLLDSKTIGGTQLHCIAVNDAKVIPGECSKLFAEVGGNRCMCGEDVLDVLDRLQAIEDRLKSFEVPASKLEALRNRVRNLEISWGDVEVLKNNVTSMQKEIQTLKFEGRNHLLDTRISELDGRFQEAASLTVRLNETLTHLDINVRKLTQDYNSSIANTDLLLREKIDELERAFTGEIKRVNQIVQNMPNVAEHLPRLYGRHPDDSMGCPGLKLLATDEHVVLSTKHGRFRAPNLPTDLLPMDSVVRFRCSPAGSYRLVGAEELRCLEGGRWSHRPPVCQRLVTREQVMTGYRGSVIAPSIYLNAVPEEDEWIYTDDDGNVVVRPGVQIRLHCLYLHSRENAVWLHNGTRVPYYEESVRNIMMVNGMVVATATLENSGEYSCQAPDGKRHSIKIKVAEVECERLKEPVNGRVVTSPLGRPLAGSSAKFSCLLGHRLVGRQEVVCLGNGRWSDLVPTCEEIGIKGCGNFETDGLVVEGRKDSYELGDSITLSCKNGTEMEPRIERMICLGDEHGWHETRLPTCIPKQIQSEATKTARKTPQ